MVRHGVEKIRPFKILEMTPANCITIARILLIIPFVICVCAHGERVELGEFMSLPRQIAMWLFGIISVSDALDGWVARITNQKSKLGAILDPAADKLLMLAATVSLTLCSWNFSQPSLFIPWVAVVLLRDSIITGLACLFWARKYHFEVKATPSAKVSTVIQFIVISHAMIFTQQEVPTWLVVPSIVMTVYTGCEYLWVAYRIWKKNVA